MVAYENVGTTVTATLLIVQPASTEKGRRSYPHDIHLLRHCLLHPFHFERVNSSPTNGHTLPLYFMLPFDRLVSCYSLLYIMAVITLPEPKS